MSDTESHITKSIMKLNEDVTEALDACMHCQYKAPKIADIFDKDDRSV